jgi:ApaG protein
MVTQTTYGIKVSVETFYQLEYSKPAEGKYVFSYRITIENQSDAPVQLLRRYWRIFDSAEPKRELEGEGVIGEQPIIPSGSSHQYVSWCHLSTELGAMRGAYLMVRLSDQEKFKVRIPEFQLTAPFRLN